MASNNISLGVIIGATLAGSFGNAFRTLDQRASSLGRSLNQVRLGRTASADVIRYSAELDRLRIVQRGVGTGNTWLNQQIASTERQLANASRAAQRYGVNLGDIVNENRRLGQSEQRIAGQLARQNTLRANRDQRSQIGSSMMGTVGLAIGAAFAVAAPIKEAVEFESKMADIRKVVDMTDSELKGLGKSILTMSKTMPMAAIGIGEIVAAAGQSGIAKNELLPFTEAAVKMGVAFDMSGDEAGKMMASWRAGMAITQPQVVSLADAVNYLDTNMNASAKNISSVIQRQGAVAKAAGLSAVQTAALAAALLNSGASDEIAATALKNLTNALTRGTAATGEQRKAYATLGLDAKATALGMQQDAEGMIKKVFGALAKAPKEMQGALVGNLFGEEAKGAIMPLLVNLKALDDAFNSVADSTKYAGSMQKEYEIRSKTTENATQLLKNQFTNLGISIGSALLPPLTQIFGALSIGASYIAGFAERFPLVTQAVIGLSFGLIGLKIATLGLAYGASLISTGWTLATGAMALFSGGTIAANAALAMQRISVIGTTVAQTAMAAWTSTVTAAQWLWNAALSANPIGLVIIGIAAFGALAYTVYKNWEPIMQWFSEKFQWLANAASKLGSFFSGGGIGQAGARASIGDFARAPANASLPAMAAANGATAGNRTVNATINVTQKPGEDSNALAERVAKHIKRQESADKRGALHD
jgi:TP901 family phage tail tape measure protein